MAKAIQIKGIDSKTDAAEGALLVLRGRFSEIVKFRDQALKPNGIDGVHDMRVATRRLRSILVDLKPLLDKRPLKPVKKEIKKVAGLLGSVRDIDVAIVTLKRLKSKARNRQIRKGIGKLITTRGDLREKARVNLEKHLKENDIKELQSRFEAAIIESIHGEKSGQSGSFDSFGMSVISRRLKEFRSLSKSIFTPYDVEALHEFRLSTKRLRYAIELFAPFGHHKIVKFAGKLSRMQDFLGEVHDCDVWIEDLSKDLISSEIKQSDYTTDMWLFSRFTEMRNKNYRSALSLWNSWIEAGVIEKLESAVS